MIKKKKNLKKNLLNLSISSLLGIVFAFTFYIIISGGILISKRYLLFSAGIFVNASILLYFVNSYFLIPSVKKNKRDFVFLLVSLFIVVLAIGTTSKIPNAYFFLPKTTLSISYFHNEPAEKSLCSVEINGIYVGYEWISLDEIETQKEGERIGDKFVINHCESGEIRWTGPIYDELLLNVSIKPYGGILNIEINNHPIITGAIIEDGNEHAIGVDIHQSGFTKFLVNTVPKMLFLICITSLFFLFTRNIAKRYLGKQLLWIRRTIQKYADNYKKLLFSNNKIFQEPAKESNQSNQDLLQPLIKSVYVWAICFFLSTIFLLICTKSSPLYPFNDWVDANVFFTMGKGMMNGKVPFRDLYDQKGPLLHLIYGFAYILSNKSFSGVFICEVVSFSVFLFYSYKLAILFVDPIHSLLLLPFITIGVLNLKAFSHGGSAEEFCLPFLAISLFYLFNYFKTVYPKPVPGKWLFINGIIAGCVLWIKFSLLGFWFGWMASLFFIMVFNKAYNRAIKGSFIFLLGMLLATLPWIIYFGINKSIYEWINVYFIHAFKYYRRSLTLQEEFISIIGQIVYNYKENPIFNTFLWLGIFTFALSKTLLENRLNGLFLLLCVLLLILGIYGGGIGFIYYFLIISPFIVLGLLTLLLIIGRFVVSMKISVILIFIISVLALPLTLHFNHNTYMLEWRKQDLVQYKFASIINQTEQATLLNYDFLDGGFYTTTGIIPNIRFFHILNISYSKFPLLKRSQKNYIRDRAVDYVVMRVNVNEKDKYLRIPNLNNNYALIDTGEQEFDNRAFLYLLFGKRDYPIK